MASPHMKSEQLFDFGDSSTQDAMGSASESSSPPGSGFGLSPPESSPPDGRRRRKDRPTWAKYTYTPDLDGHLWRKYGQKKIKDADFPRLYYRCSYRDDRQCLASKLMQQQNNEDPPLYHVTYTYEHTCGAPPVPLPDIVVEQPPAAREGQGLVLRFDSPGGQQWQPQSTSPSPYTMLSFGSRSNSQQPVFCSDPGAGSSSSPFPTKAAPAPASTNGGDDMYSTWNSFSYDLDDHMQYGGHGHFPCNTNDYDHDY